nr:MAG TPA: hypothetical protein [Caudoviricetes sp.]
MCYNIGMKGDIFLTEKKNSIEKSKPCWLEQGLGSYKKFENCYNLRI